MFYFFLFYVTIFYAAELNEIYVRLRFARKNACKGTSLGLRLNTIRDSVAHMNLRLDLRFPHRKHYFRFTLGSPVVPLRLQRYNKFTRYANFCGCLSVF